MVTRRSSLFAALLITVLALSQSACSGGSGDASATGRSENTETSGLTPEQIEKGIGPVQHVAISEEVDAALASKGEEIFSMKCNACHKMNDRYVGPALGDVVERRTPEFVMNMMLNPQEMIEKHPAVTELLKQYMTPMPNQSLTEQDARAVLEYLRKMHQESAVG